MSYLFEPLRGQAYDADLHWRMIQQVIERNLNMDSLTVWWRTVQRSMTLDLFTHCLWMMGMLWNSFWPVSLERSKRPQPVPNFQWEREIGLAW